MGWTPSTSVASPPTTAYGPRRWMPRPPVSRPACSPTSSPASNRTPARPPSTRSAPPASPPSDPPPGIAGSWLFRGAKISQLPAIRGKGLGQHPLQDVGLEEDEQAHHDEEEQAPPDDLAEQVTFSARHADRGGRDRQVLRADHLAEAAAG